MSFKIKHQQFIPWLRKLMRSRRLMVVVKYLLPFLAGVLHPHLSLLVGFSIFLWDFNNS